jgi:hypothetical protein
MTNDPMIAALLRERDGYVKRGMDDRAALVDEQLALRGHQKPAQASTSTPEPADADARAEPPKGRKMPRKDKG